MKNKRGSVWLPEESSKMVIAVIVLIFLVYFAFRLYYAKIYSDEYKQAEATLERLKDVIKSSNGSEVVSGITPEGWYVVGFIGDEEKPLSCLQKNCLCICQDENKCDEKGTCSIFENLQDFNKIKIEDVEDSLTNILIKKEGGKIIISKA